MSPVIDDPNLQIGPVSIWMAGRSFPEAADAWDRDQIACHVEARTPFALITPEAGSISSLSVMHFLHQLKGLHGSLSGSAILDGSDLGLVITLTHITLGHIRVQSEFFALTDWEGPLRHVHELDQTYLPGLIDQCRVLLELYPVQVPHEQLISQ